MNADAITFRFPATRETITRDVVGSTTVDGEDMPLVEGPEQSAAQYPVAPKNIEEKHFADDSE